MQRIWMLLTWFMLSASALQAQTPADNAAPTEQPPVAKSPAEPAKEAATVPATAAPAAAPNSPVTPVSPVPANPTAPEGTNPGTAKPSPGTPATPGISPETAGSTTGGTPGSTSTMLKTKTPDDASGADIWYMLDKNQQLQRVLNIPYEEFMRIRDAMRDLGSPTAPPYTIQSQKITGSAGADTVDLRIELKILLHTDQLVKIPLGLNQAVKRSSKYEGDGHQYWSFEDAGDGYISWLKGTADKEHTIVMDMVVPLVKLGGETALRIGLPPAITSEFTVDVDVPNAIGRVAEDDTRKLSTRNFATGKTQFSLVGVHGDFELAWRPADRPAPTVLTEFTSTGTLQVRIDGPSIQTDARLNISSSGGEFEQIRLRLPAGAKLLPGAPAGYEFVPVEGQTAEDMAEHGTLLDVKLSQKTSEPIEIRLRTEQSRSGKSITKGVDLAGFAVIGAARQWGYVAVEVVGDWQVQWVKQQNVRRIEKLPDAPVASDPVASFEYFGQPFVLTAHISPRTTRIRVEPEYVVLIGPRQMTLDARLKYNIRGASEFALVVSVPGWTDVEIDPTEGVDDKNVLLEGNQLTVPLQPPRTGPFELRLKARRMLDEGGIATFTLPTPRATTQTTSTVVVLPDDNVDLTPHQEGFAGLTPEHVLPRFELPVRQQEPLVYRGEPSETKFSAQVRVLPQTIDVDVNSVVHLEREAWRVDQKITYHVEFEPVDHVTLLAPKSEKNGSKPEISFDGQLLEDSALAWETPAESPPMNGEAPATAPPAAMPAAPARLRVKLPAPARFGRFELLVSYPLALQNLTALEPTRIEAPLLLPAEGQLGENTAVVLAPSEVRVTKVGAPWIAQVADPDALPGRGLQLHVAERADKLPLTVELEEHVTPGTTVIDLAWVQSWLTSTERQDRACYRFTTSEDHLELRLPSGVTASAVQVILDGFPVYAEVSTGGRLSVGLPHAAAARKRHLELQYRFPERTNSSGQLTLEAPQLLGGAWVQTTYWQVILPPDELLISAPTTFVQEYVWGWNGLFRAQRPLHEQAELEAMVGVTSGLPVPGRTNRYLFRDVGSPTEITLTTSRLSLLVFACSLLVLVVGLVPLYFPILRRPWLLAVAVIVLLPLAVRYPSTGLILAEAATVGVLLVLLAGLLRAMLRLPQLETAPQHLPSPIETHPPAEPRSSTRSYISESQPSSSSAATTIALHTSEAGE